MSMKLGIKLESFKKGERVIDIGLKGSHRMATDDFIPKIRP